MTTPTPIEEVKCELCKHYEIKKNFAETVLGMATWTESYCNLHKLKTKHDNTCKEFKHNK